MKPILVSLLFLLSYSNVYSQDISAGMRVGASKWIDHDIVYKGISPEIVVFIRAEPVKRLALDLGFSAYNLEHDLSNAYFSSLYSERKQQVKCKEISLTAQYNYLRFFRNSLKLYAGMDISPTYSTMVMESKLMTSQNPALTPYVNSTMRFWFFMLGINQTFTYQVGNDLNVITTVSYRGNISPLNNHFYTYRMALGRIGMQAGISYQIN